MGRRDEVEARFILGIYYVTIQVRTGMTIHWWWCHR